MDCTFINRQTVLSIGPGQLGIERGVESVIGPVRVAAYVEIEAFVIQNLIGLMEKGVVDPAPVWADIKSFRYGRFRDKIHGITAGYPCQPFSLAGKRKGTDDPRHLWPYIQRIIESTKPLWCFFENVAGHLTLGFDEVYRSLRQMGYRVEAGIFTAQEVGAPHLRQRLFILAVGNTTDWNEFWDRSRSQNGHIEIGRPGDLLEDTFGTTIGCECGEIGRRVGQEDVRQGNGEECSVRIGTTSELADELRQGLAERKIQPTWQEFSAIERSSVITRWPSGPGNYQYPWEPPRTIEPGMGCTVDGYNFREDLLRMYGNGVVSQTAALAWVTLWSKHLKSGIK